MKSFTITIVLLMLGVVVHGFSGSDEKFVKKYAMMKIYESCFGPEVVKQIRKEMKAACLKCAVSSEPAPVPEVPAQAQRPTAPAQSESTKHGLPQQQHETLPENDVHQPQFDAEKLHQAILAYRPNPFPQQQFRPYTNQGPFYPGYSNPGNVFYPQGFPGPSPYSPYTPAFPGYYPQQFYPHGQRMSRDMNVQNQIEYLTNRISGRVRNVTCVMQELGYLDDNLEPNFEKISARITDLPVDEELKRDMQEGVSFCQQFSQCLPDVKEKSPLSRELLRPMFFFRCYKHKKLEACIMKDVRERFNQDSDEDFDLLTDGVRSGRTGKGMKNEDLYEEFASSFYEHMLGENSDDIDL